MEQFNDTQLITLILTGILLMTFMALGFVLFFNYSQKKILAEKAYNQELELKYQKELLHQTLMTQEEERRRIAKDLHDDIGSKLNVLNLNLHRLDKVSKDNESLQEIVGEMYKIIDTSINTTRRISHDLLPPTLENFGLLEAIRELCDGINSAHPNLIDFRIVTNESKIEEKALALNLFRVIQELINNSIKHAHATKIELFLWFHPEHTEITYSDNGRGMAIEKLRSQRGLGLKNIDSRLSMIGAEVKFDSAPGEGFNVAIHLNTKYHV